MDLLLLIFVAGTWLDNFQFDGGPRAVGRAGGRRRDQRDRIMTFSQTDGRITEIFTGGTDTKGENFVAAGAVQSFVFTSKLHGGGERGLKGRREKVKVSKNGRRRP